MANSKNISKSASSYPGVKEPIFFWKDDEPWGFFCQWYKAPFTYKGPEVPEGQLFNCAEQFFMWRKALQFDDTDSARCILKENNPKKQKALGRGVTGFVDEEWDAVKQKVCEEVSMLKFTQCMSNGKDGTPSGVPLKKLLLQTGERELFEASPFDRVWGIGEKASIAQNQTSRKTWGQNLLGLSLMKTRDELGKHDKGKAKDIVEEPEPE